jgi:hypothetical protein
LTCGERKCHDTCILASDFLIDESLFGMLEPGTQPQPKVVCVLGMHRSGTSLLTGALRLLGVHLGSDENLLPSDEEANRKGFWENRRIVDLNDALLSRLGGDWHNLPEFPPDWFSSPNSPT